MLPLTLYGFLCCLPFEASILGVRCLQPVGSDTTVFGTTQCCRRRPNESLKSHVAGLHKLVQVRRIQVRPLVLVSSRILTQWE